jgi:flagellar biosynthesis/type III secretory pathway chaperone
MRAFYDQLVIVLEDEVKVYRVLLDLVRREKEILTSTKLKDLEDCNRQKEILINKVKGLERIREKHVFDLAAAVGA